MRTPWWRKLLGFGSTSISRRRSRYRRLHLETLEDRTLPSASVASLANPISGATTANGESQVSPMRSLSDNGHLTVYASLASNLVANQTTSTSGPTLNLFLYNNQTSTTTLITAASGSSSQTANGNSFNAVISGDGSTVAFYSIATNLISGVTIPSGAVELYVYNVSTGKLTLASAAFGSPTQGSNSFNPAIPASPSSHWANMFAYSSGSASVGQDIDGLALPSLSASGQYIAYIDDATNLGAANTGIDGSTGLAETQVFLYDVANGTNTLVSHAAGTPTTSATGPNGAWADTASISADGSTVAFSDPGTNLVSGQNTDGVSDQLYVWSRINNSTTGLSAGQTVLASHAAGSNLTGASIPSNLSSSFGYSEGSPPTLSANGNEVAYYYAGSNLVASQAGTASVLNVFLYTISTNSNVLVTHIAGTTATDLATAGNNPQNQVAGPGQGPVEANGPQISADGKYIAYANNSDNLIVNAGWTGSITDASSPGTIVITTSSTANLTSGEFVTIAGVGGNTAANGTWSINVLSPTTFALTGSTGSAAYTSGGTWTYAGADNVYLYDNNSSDAAYQTNALVSHAAGSTTAPDAGGGTAPSITADGRYVSFMDFAIPASGSSTGSAGIVNVRLFDRQAAGTAQATVVGEAFDTTPLPPATGSGANVPVTMAFYAVSLAPTILSGDGSTLVWDGPATTVVPGVTDNNANFDVFIASTAVPTKLLFTTTSQTLTAGVLSSTITVQEEDSSGNPTTSAETINLSSSNTSTGVFKDTSGSSTITSVTIPAGSSTASFTYLDTLASTPTLTAQASGLVPATQGETVSAGAASQLAITQQPSATATAGVAFNMQPVVKEEDGFGNVITTDSTDTVTVARGNHGTASLQGGPLTVTLANGVATFSGLSYNVAETLNLSFTTNAGAFTATSNDIAVSPGAASQLVVTQQPSPTATAGVAFSTQPVVKEEDSFGNVIASDSTHTVTVARGNHGTASLQGGPLTVTLASGVATFSGLSYNVAETMNLSFTTNAGAFTATSNDIVVSPAAASQLVVTQQPSATATAGVAFSTQPVVKEEDSFGNLITTDSTDTVTVARGNHGTASLQGGPLTVTLASGVATFSGLSYNVSETMNLSFTTNAGSFTATSNDIAVSPGAASQLVVTQQPSATATAGVAFSTQPVVKEEDGFGNVITADSTHTVAVARGNHGTASLQGGPLTVTLANGVATFSGLSYNVAETMNLSFTTNAGAFTTTSNDIAVSAAAANQLVVTQQPSATATVGVPFSTQPVVKEEDGFGNVITTDNTHTVTVARGSLGTASLQGGPLTVTLASGVATFSGLSYNVAETLNLSFTTNAGAFTATSANITVVGPASISAMFGAATLAANSTTTLSFTISNSNVGTALSGVGFTDTLPAGLVVATPNGLSNNAPGGGTVTATAGSNTITLTGATVAANGSITFLLDVVGTVAGLQNDSTSAVTSNEGGSGNTGSAGVTVIPVVTPGTTLLTTTSTTLTIDGVGFDSNPANDHVTFSGGVTGTISAATATTLTVTGLTGLNVGPLSAAVTVNGAVSNQAQVATVSSDVVINDNTAGDTLTLTQTTGTGTVGDITYVLGTQAPVILTGVTAFTFNGAGGQDTMIVTLPTATAGVLVSGSVAFNGKAGTAQTLTINASGLPVQIEPGAVVVGDPQRVTYTSVTTTNINGAGSINTIYGPDTADRTTAFTGLTAQERFVQALYLDELGRAGSVSELNSWIPVLNANSAAVVAGDIAHSGEATDHLVKTWYQTYLGRTAAGGEEQSFVNSLLQGASEEVVLSRILGSSEFFNHALTLVASGTPQERYVQALYQLLLGRTGGTSEVAGWVSALPQMGEIGVALNIVQSQECRTDLVEGYYNVLLHRPADLPGLEGWVFSGQDALTIRVGIEASAEFFTNG
jgi:hypothetical protein